VASRPKIEFVEDAKGVRIDVTTSQRVDLALREVHKGFEIRVPELEARRLAVAEAFVHGRRVRARRRFPDWLFEINVTAPRRGEPWDSAYLRADAPGDTTGALSSRRYIDLAPQSEEAQLFGRLAEQETVRVCWVTEGVELLYRPAPKHRDYWREALATNETQSDEDRAARYEQLLAGHVTMRELPFYRRVTPRRPRRTAERPASPIPFFAKRSGAVPSARRPTIAGVRLPPGRRGPDSLPSYWISDEPLDAAGDTAGTIAGAFEETGQWPLLWSWNEDPASYLEQPIEPDQVDAVDVEAVLRRAWERIAEHPDGLVEPVGPRWPGLAEGSQVDPTTTRDPFQLAELSSVSARLMIVPCNRPADCVALIGGLAANEIDIAEISALIRSWEERFGAVLVAVEPCLATLAITAPPSEPEQALTAAAEQFGFCPPNTVEAGTLQELASVLLGQAAPSPGGHLPLALSASLWHVAWYD
jgi:Domain of unknown function (DUF4253)